MLLIGTLLCWQVVITLICPDIHYISENDCSRINFSFHFLIFDCTHAQANSWPLPSYILIIPSLPPHPNTCPRLIQWFLWLQLRVDWHGGCADVGSMTLSSSLGCPALTTQLTSVVCIRSMSYTLTVTSWKPSHHIPQCDVLGSTRRASHVEQGKRTLWPPPWSDYTYFEVSLVHVQVWCPPSGASISYTTLRCSINYYVHILLLNFYRKLCW